MRTALYPKRRVFIASLFAPAVELAEELGVLEVSDPVKFTLRLEIGNDFDVSVRVTILPFVQKLEVPGLPAVNRTPAHYLQPASIAVILDREYHQEVEQ